MHINALVAQIAAQLEPVYHDKQASHDAAWLLLEHCTKLSKTALITQAIAQLSPEQTDMLKAALNKITHEHMPLQYILGTVPFLDLTITVRPPTLIPRPETEEWCALLIESLKLYANKKLTILDLCTGSGCIALALAKAFPHSTVYATDISAEALELAAYNAQQNNIFNVQFVQADLYANLPNNITFDLIVANPPYISEHEWDTVEPSVKQWEDLQALVAAQDGYALIARIIQDAPQFLRTQTASDTASKAFLPALWIEIGYRQGTGTRELFEQHKFTQVTIEKDLNGHDRVVHGVWQ